MALRSRIQCVATSRSWRDGLPVLRTDRVALRELRRDDAPALIDVTARDEVVRFSWPAPDNLAAVERFIQSTREERASGRYLCFGIVPVATGAVAGMFELRRLQPDFFRAEIGFFMTDEFRGKGVFADAARLLIDFAFGVVGVHRIEARVAVDNERSSAALRKLGAEQEGVLRDAFVRDGRYVDQVLWALVRRRWPAQASPAPASARTASS